MRQILVLELPLNTKKVDEYSLLDLMSYNYFIFDPVAGWVLIKISDDSFDWVDYIDYRLKQLLLLKGIKS